MGFRALELRRRMRHRQPTYRPQTCPVPLDVQRVPRVLQSARQRAPGRRSRPKIGRARGTPRLDLTLRDCRRDCRAARDTALRRPARMSADGSAASQPAAGASITPHQRGRVSLPRALGPVTMCPRQDRGRARTAGAAARTATRAGSARASGPAQGQATLQHSCRMSRGGTGRPRLLRASLFGSNASVKPPHTSTCPR